MWGSRFTLPLIVKDAFLASGPGRFFPPYNEFPLFIKMEVKQAPEPGRKN